LIARAALENYLVFSHIYDAKDLKRSEFRHTTWRMGGLMDRQQYKSNLNQNKLKQKSEAEIIVGLLARIRIDPHFKNLSKRQQAKLIEGQWRMNFQWIDLALEAGLDEHYFLNIYKHLCGYSHTAYLSTVQIRDSWKSYEH
jgi:hypothetical protein